MVLRELQQRLIEGLQEHLSVIAAGHPVEEVGEVYEEVEEYFQATACCALLVSADREGFQRHLFWSALARRYFLQRSQEQGSADDFRCARSRSNAFFCAVVAGDMALALEIGDLSPEQWRQEGEYEEDFAYHLFLHRLLKGVAQQERGELLRYFEKALGGTPSPRFDLCQALQNEAAEDFESALQELVDSHAAELEALRPQSTDVPTFEPRSRIFIEGLALLRIAASVGLPLSGEQDYRFCPRSGLVKPLRSRPDDIFAQMASISGGRTRPQRP
ncbi:MAG TPA: Imm49 family immunity protein [Myxococcaceae bacterium]|nr:Imm49 family immunity protein [Myxococcaceae bacterium]